MSTEELQFQVNSAVNTCEGRISCDANIPDAFNWLQEELDQIFAGKALYEH